MRNILITGATSGIGDKIAQVLSKSNDVFMSGRRKLDKVNYYACDLVDMFEIEALYNRAIEYFNSDIDVLINCAGQYIYRPIEKMELDEISYLLDVNFKSAYILSSLVIPGMKKKKWGRIINIGSISGVVGEANASLYSATKSAFSGFTKALALEVATDNITVNTINPGWVETPLVQNALNQEDIQEVIDVTPQKRFVEPIEIARLCQYLITDYAKGITGQGINLCAGLTCGS
ncbi:MAG: SDR family oxidoreductase [Candidatus Gastranaerophilales bacterium]|nr:SDR family oxidoreductase [Candidatus Gastranaerophilales bacterium]